MSAKMLSVGGKVLLVIVLISTFNCGYGEYYTSMVGLEELLRTENVLMENIKEYIAKSHRDNGALKIDLSAAEIEHKLAYADTHDYLTNPVNVFRLIKRLYYDWWRRAAEASDFLDLMNRNYVELEFPSYTDYEEAALALLRLQKTYDLNVTDVASGKLNGVKYGNDMSWSDCLHLSQILLSAGAFNQSKLWIEEFSKRFPADSSLDVKQQMPGHLMKIGDLDIILQIFNAVLDQDLEAFDSLCDMYRQLYLMTDAMKEQLDYHSSQEYQLYEKVCRLEVTRTPQELRPLRCRYHWGECAFCRLAPLKMEEINVDPLILVFHQMVSDRQIETIKDYALPLMRRSTVRNDYGDASKRDNYRLSKNAWMPYDIDMLTLKLLRDLDDATGLDMRQSEEMQVANYGFGGHYEPHFDFYFSVHDEVPHNRLTTSIAYLSDVEEGGATAFPFLKIAVKPSKGDVLFWYNLHRSLDGDYRTKHAGCPVLKGSKWIGNVWTSDLHQDVRRPCGLYRDNEVSLEYRIVA